jgi:glycosyltransferase involved in cell wall biosynthesis
MNARTLTDDSLRGFNRYIVNLVRELELRDDVDVTLYTHKRSPVHPRFRSILRSPVVDIAAARVLWWEQVRLPAALRRNGVDVFHAPTDNGMPLSGRVPCVLTYHSATDVGIGRMVGAQLQGPLADFVETGTRTAQWRHEVLRALYLKRAARIITVSECSARELITSLRVPAEKLRVVYEAPDPSFHVRLSRERIDATVRRHGIVSPYLLFVSGFDTRKNVTGLLHVFAGIRQRLTSHTLVLAGVGGDVAGAKTLAARLGLRQGVDVFFLERVQEDLPALYQGADLFVTLAWWETFCFPLVEAMASGVPVVASSFGAIPEIAGGAAILVDPRDHDLVAKTVVDVLENHEVRRDLVVRGAARVKRFDWGRAASETIDVYREVLS